MPCRGASTPAAAAAAAVAAWPLTPLVLALSVFSAMPHVALSRGPSMPPALPPLQANSQLQMKPTCYNVPYPFGLRGKSARGFRVTCGPNNTNAMLRIGHQRFRIDHVSLQEGFVVLSAGPIYQLCYDRNGRPAAGSTGIGPMNLTDTPFFFSKRNRLVATGCNNLFHANFTSSRGKPWPTSSCGTWCSGNDTIISGSCLGTACCEVPMPTDGAQEFTFNFYNTSASVTGEEAGTCSAVFILDQEEKMFTNGSDGSQIPLKDALVPSGERKMVLDWVVGARHLRAGQEQQLSATTLPLQQRELVHQRAKWSGLFLQMQRRVPPIRRESIRARRVHRYQRMPGY